MRDASAQAGRLLRDSEVNYLRYGLRLDAPASLQKRTLQRLCEYYERGRRIQDTGEVRQMIHSHLGSPEVLVRRWAIKALALIGHPDDFPRIVDRLRVEDDMEAQTWGMTGLVKNARDRGVDELCAMANLPRTSAVLLAARLYAPKSWLARNAASLSISLDADELTLKWATFLIGYDRAPVDLFHPRFSNEVFLGQLNAHDAPDISEYSIWALWLRDGFGATHSKIPLLEVNGHPESVRKWLYRLATQSPDQVGLDADCLSELRRDAAPRAREGLALGVEDLDPAHFGTEVLDWYTIETSEQVRENLLASMAARSRDSADYADAVERRFAGEQADSPLRRQLLAACEGTPLYSNLRRLDIAAARDRQGLLEYDKRPMIIHGDYNEIYGDSNVTGPTLNFGGSLNAQNVAIGDMINSANGAVMQLERSDQGAAQALQQVLSMLAASKVDEGRAEVAAAVEQVAKAPTQENRKGLVDRLKDYGAKAAAAGAAIGSLDKLIESVQGWIS